MNNRQKNGRTVRLAIRFVGILVSIAALFAGLGVAYGQSLRAVKSGPEGEVRYVAPVSRVQALRGVTAATTPGVAGRVALRDYAIQFGIENADAELQELSTFDYGSRGRVVRYRQLRDGLPVIGGDLVVTLTREMEFASMAGKTSARTVANTVPTITYEQAQRIAGIAVAKYHRIPITSLTAGDPELSIYDPQMIHRRDASPSALVWRLDIGSVDAGRPVRQFVLIDAQSGAMALNFDRIETLRNRLTYTANGTTGTKTLLVCNEAQPLCTNGTNLDADAAHRYAGEMYDFYFSRYGRDSYDNAGAALVQTVNTFYTGCPNAAWLGDQMVYCPGAPLADDVVGHELTHAVTQYTSNLLYYYESGAINESYSDIFGEFLDLSNTTGTDTAAVRWKMGEDFGGSGAIRDMMNPPAFSDPDRMSSPLYWKTTGDGGGVHTNSGVNNKAAALMVDGGVFNGFTITGLGIDKVARLYYEVATHHLTSASGYADLYTALRQACQDLIGQHGFVAGDCTQVNNTTNAVEMNVEPGIGFNPDAAVCPVGSIQSNLFYDNFETAPTAAWSTSALTGLNGWGVRTGYASSGTRSYAIVSALGAVSDSSLTQASGVVLPANAFLHFRHANDYEFSGAAFHDGGVVEYTIDNGATWTDIGALFDAGKTYGGVLSAGNPLAGRQAFVGSSHGYVSSRYNLSSRAGSTIRLRFRNTADASIASTPSRAWVIDDVRIYTCVADTTPNLLPVANAGADRSVSSGTNIALSAAASSDSDGEISSVLWTQVSGPSIAIASPNAWTINVIAPGTGAQDTAILRLRVTDNRGATATDDVSIEVVNRPPTANAGPDRTVRPRTSVFVAGSGSDPDGSAVGFLWTQVGGPTVVMTNAATSVMTFVTPTTATSATMTFRLRVTDTFGGVGTDDVTVTALNAAPVVNLGVDRSGKPRNAIPISATVFDPDGLVAALAWTQVSGPSITLPSVANATTFTFLAPSVASTGTVVLRATATDNEGGTGSDDISIVLTNTQPTANAGADRSVAAGTTLSVSGFGSDGDGTIASYEWTQLDGPSVALSGAASAVATFAAPSLASSSTVVLRLKVTDNDGGTATDDVAIGFAAISASSGGGGGGGGFESPLLIMLGALALFHGRRRNGTPAT